MTSHFQESEFEIIDYFTTVAALSVCHHHTATTHAFFLLCFIDSN